MDAAAWLSGGGNGARKQGIPSVGNAKRLEDVRFAVQLGAGAERRMRQRIWLRVEGDYLRSQLYGSGQNNF
jgi:hypothetical protein